jgi:hypothetical protein
MGVSVYPKLEMWGLRMGDSRSVAANQEIGTRMVMEAQIESGTLSSQYRGGPLNVTNMLAAVTEMVGCFFPLAMAQSGRGKGGDSTYLQHSENTRPSAFKPHT